MDIIRSVGGNCCYHDVNIDNGIGTDTIRALGISYKWERYVCQ